MGRAFEVISGKVTGVGATLTAWTVNPGDSLGIRSFDVSKKAWLIDMWALNDTAAGVLRIRSPRLHDNVQGIRQRILNNNTEPLLSGAGTSLFPQRLYSQDLLIAEQSGSAANLDTGHIVILYDDLPGVAARLIDNNTLMQNGVNRIGQEVTVTPGAASGQYGGAVAINSTNDNFKANTDYALLGATTDVRIGVIGVRGADIGNLRVPIPAEPAQRHICTNYFQRLTDAYGQPLIPVFNSANKQAILIDGTGLTGALTAVVELQMVELAPKSGGSSGGQFGV
jgi:hypothetical protein